MNEEGNGIVTGTDFIYFTELPILRIGFAKPTVKLKQTKLEL